MLQHAAGKEAQRNFDRTVRNPWTIRALGRLGQVEGPTLEALRRVHGDEPFGIWATTRGMSGLTTAKFEKIGRGDVVAFIATGSKIFYAARVGAVVHDLTLGNRLGWERPATKLPYEHIYTITHGHPVDLDARRELRQWLPSNGVVLGFSVKEVPAAALRSLQDELTAPREVVVVAQPDDAPRDELDAAHQIKLRDVAVKKRSPFADDAFERNGDPKRQRELLERAIESHQNLLKKLRDAFEAGDASCTEDPNGVDLLVRWPDLALVVEVKSTWGGFVGPVRNAVAQLYEYQYHLTLQRHLSGPHSLVVALDRAPRAASWVRDYLTRDRAMTLITQARNGTLRIEGALALGIAARVPQLSATKGVASASEQSRQALTPNRMSSRTVMTSLVGRVSRRRLHV